VKQYLLREIPRTRKQLVDSAKGWLVAFLKALVFYAVVGLIFYLVYELLLVWHFFSASIPHDVALEMFRGLMEVEGVLIGFVGLIATFALTDVRSMLDRLPKEESVTREALEARLQIVKKFMDRRSAIVRTTGITIIVLIGSIIFALGWMSYLSGNAGAHYFFIPILFLLWGIAGMLWLLLLTTAKI
jgi:hypothetical protein